MRRTRIPAVAFVLCMAAAAGSHAQTHYVTDKVLVGLYEEPSTESRIIKVIATGTPLEVLKRGSKFYKVRGPDGATGWVDAAYLIDNKPAQLRVLELADRNKQLEEELGRARTRTQDLQGQVKKLEGQLAARSETAPERERLQQLEASNAELKKRLTAAEKKLTAEAEAARVANEQLEELRAEHVAPRDQADEAQAGAQVPEKVAALKTRVQELEETLQSRSAELQTASREVGRLKATNEGLRERVDRIRELLGVEQPAPAAQPAGETSGGIWWWLVVGVVLAALAGFAGGAFWLDHRHRHRHGGFRI